MKSQANPAGAKTVALIPGYVSCRLIKCGRNRAGCYKDAAVKRRERFETLFSNGERKECKAIEFAPGRRRISEIESRVASHRAIREKREQEAHLAAEARRRKERTRYLTSLLEQEDTAWSSIDAQLRRTTGSAYDQAFQKLQDLTEAYENAGRDAVFRRRLAQLMSSHGKRGAWLARLHKAGYLWQPKS